MTSTILRTITYPLKLPSVANLCEHWRAKASRTKSHRLMAWTELRRYGMPPLQGHVTVTLTRIAPRQLDTDNLASAFKATRDGVADYFGVQDNDPRITWKYAQERGAPKHYAVRIEVIA